MSKDFLEGFNSDVKRDTKIRVIKWSIVIFIIAVIAVFSGLKINNYYLAQKAEKSKYKTTLTFQKQTNQNKYANYKDDEILRVDYPKNNESVYYPMTIVSGAVLKNFEVYVNGIICSKESANEWYDYFIAFIPLNTGNNDIKIEAKKENKVVSRALSVNVLDTELAYNFNQEDYISNYSYLSDYSFTPFSFEASNLNSNSSGADILQSYRDWLVKVRTQISETEIKRTNDLQREKNSYDSKVATAKNNMESQLNSLDCNPALSGRCAGQQDTIVQTCRNLINLYRSHYENMVEIINEFADSKIDSLKKTEQELLNKISGLGG